MSASVRSREIRVPVQSLRRGLFVSALDRAWSGTPFAFQGFLIEAELEIETLKGLCRWVAIDPDHSDPAALGALPLPPREPQPPPPTIRRPLPVAAAPAPSATTPRGEPVAWLHRNRKPGAQRKAAARDRAAWPPIEALDANLRSPLVPESVALVRYTNESAFETEIEAADEAVSIADDTLRTLLDGMSQGGEMNLSDLRSSAQDLASSVARNPDALQWLVRMRDRNAAIYAHGVKVAVYLLSFARHLGFAPAELVQMASIGLLLDVGKIFIEDELLRKKEPLTAGERARVQQHVEVGVNALAAAGALPPGLSDAILEHHERMDGTGYPRGLPAESISIQGRMAAIADSFAAMTSPRAYAPTLPPYKAMKVMYAEAGSKFHAPLVEQFVQAIGIFPTGSLVQLSTGEVALVACHNRVRRLEPRVLVVADRRKKRLDMPYELDLMTQPEPQLGGKRVRIDRGLPAGAYGLDLAALYAD